MKITLGVVVALTCLLLPTRARQADTNRQPFSINLAADNVQVRAGSNVCVRVSVTNDSSQNLNLNGGAGGYTNLDPNYRFEVRYEGGDLAKKRTYPTVKIFDTRYRYIVKPNATHSSDQCPSAQFDMRIPGQYTIQAFRLASEGSQGEEIASNVVTVTVVPTASGAQQPFNIIIAPSKPSFTAGSDVCVHISLTNDSLQTLDMSGGLYGRHANLNPNYRFEVRDANGDLAEKRVFSHPEIMAGGSPLNYAVKTGETYNSEECPSDVYDISKPGSYTIQYFRRASEKPNAGEIGSNVATVTVEP